MILRRYGTTYQSVDMDFTAEALNEIGFRRDREHSIPVEEFEGSYAHIETVSLTAEADGKGQNETEQLLLDRLAEKIEAQLARVPEGGVLVVENDKGHDYPRTQQVTRNVVERGENRLYFHYTIAPPLRVAIYRPAD